MQILRAVLVSASVTSAFLQATSPTFRRPSLLRATDTNEAQSYLAENYPAFASLVATLSKNGEEEDIWRATGSSEAGITIFAPNVDAFEELGKDKRASLNDPRNGESVYKIIAHHFINEKVSSEQLFDSGGVRTEGGVVPIGRSKSGGFMGMGGTEDGGITISGASVVKSFEIPESDIVIHEVDKFVSPQILWRYVDQLRIPGTQ